MTVHQLMVHGVYQLLAKQFAMTTDQHNSWLPYGAIYCTIYGAIYGDQPILFMSCQKIIVVKTGHSGFVCIIIK